MQAGTEPGAHVPQQPAAFICSPGGQLDGRSSRFVHVPVSVEVSALAPLQYVRVAERVSVSEHAVVALVLVVVPSQ